MSMKNKDHYHRRLLELDIYRALKNDELDIYLQPQIHVMSGKIVGFEALVRWIHPVMGVLEPKQFLPQITLQKTKEQLDYYVFEKACALLHKRFCEGKKLFCISCNFVREHFVRLDFVNIIQKIRMKYQVPSRYLSLEIVEGKAFFFDAIVQKNVEELKRLGYLVCLDDCGADNSTLSDLLFHSISHIKIDKKVTDKIKHENVQILVNGLCRIAHRLSCGTVCEGVETLEQMELVKCCGVDIIQGFYFYHPMEIEKAESLYDTASA